MNYGCSTQPTWWEERGQNYWWLNPPWVIPNSANKIKCFKLLRSGKVPTVDWTEDRAQAEQWAQDGRRVFARTKIAASKAKGLVVVEPRTRPPAAKLYTAEFQKTYEYRVHVGTAPTGGVEVIDITQKKRRKGKTPNLKVRNLSSGWVFCRNDIVPLNDRAIQICKDAIKACDLDYAGVDLLVKKNGDAVVCELNTSPAMMGTTLKKYSEWYSRWCNKWKEENSGQ